MKKEILSLFVGMLILSPISFGQGKSIHTYICGNSLVHHTMQVNPTPSQETSAPHWMQFIAQDAGNTFEVSGNFSALPLLLSQNQIPLENNWGFDSIPGGWDSRSTSFGQSTINNVIFTPLNYLQYQPPTANYDAGDTQNSPITAADTLIDWVLDNKPGTPIYIYEGWPDMATYTNTAFPPTQTQWQNYQADAGYSSDFHDWFLELHDSLVNRFPNECIKMIPVGPIICEILDRAPYNTIPIDTLYEDDAPHGRPSIYMMAGLITYMALYEETAPATYAPPTQFIDPTIIAEYPNLVDDIWIELLNFDFFNGNSRVFCDASVSVPKIEETQLTIYLNPSNGDIQIETSINEGTITVQSITGQIIFQSRLESTFQLRGLSKGIYFVRVQDETEISEAIEKVIIQ